MTSTVAALSHFFQGNTTTVTPSNPRPQQLQVERTRLQPGLGSQQGGAAKGRGRGGCDLPDPLVIRLPGNR